MSQTDSSQFQTIDEELVAYLDGQLDPESARQVEQRLASEDRIRRRLQELAQSWDMLDQLPHAVADDTFTRSTVQMVALAAEKEVTEQQAVEPRRRRRRWLLGGAVALLAAGFGFFAAAKVWTDPNEKLVRDLSTIENLEAYTQVGDIEFLRRLSDEGIFPDDAADSAAAKPAGADAGEARSTKDPPPSGFLNTPDERRGYLAKMSPQAREELRTKFETFQTLSPDEQQKLRSLDDKLNVEPREDHLRRVMARYSDWLKTLLTTERAELSDSKKSAAHRIQLLRSLRHGQEARLAAIASVGPLSKFTKPDISALHKWMENFATHHETELLKDARPRMKNELSTATGQHRTELLAILAWQHLRPNENGTPIPISDEELKELKNQLSKSARDALEVDPDKQIEKIRRWVQIVAQAYWFNRRGGNRSKVSDEELHRFFESLSTDERDRLLSLPADEMRNQLRIAYFRDVFYRSAGTGEGSGLRERPDSPEFPRPGGRRGGLRSDDPNRSAPPPKPGDDSRTNAKQSSDPASQSTPRKIDQGSAK